MDYHELKDRDYKHRYISKLMEIEAEFLRSQKSNPHKPQ